MAHGGLLSNVPENFTITFACTPNKITKSDVQVNVQFENEQIIPLYFSKECNFETADEEYFNLIYTIYWILLFLISFFIIAIIFYYIKANNFTFEEIMRLVIDKITDFYYKIKVKITIYNKIL